MNVNYMNVNHNIMTEFYRTAMCINNKVKRLAGTGGVTTLQVCTHRATLTSGLEGCFPEQV